MIDTDTASSVHLAKAQQKTFFADTDRLQNLNLNSKDPESLKAVASEFEALFLQMALKSMRDAQNSLKSDMFSGAEADHYEEMYDKQLALHLAQSGNLGLADAIVRQMSQNAPQPKSENAKSGDSLTINRGFKQLSVKEGDFYPLGNSGSAGLKLPTVDNGPKQFLLKQDDFKSLSPKKSAPSAEQLKQIEELNHKQKLASLENLQQQERASIQINSPAEFVKKLWPFAVEAAGHIGVDPKILIAQSALETGWGKSIAKSTDGQSSHNLFGIKADAGWKGETASSKTTEYRGGVLNR